MAEARELVLQMIVMWKKSSDRQIMLEKLGTTLATGPLKIGGRVRKIFAASRTAKAAVVPAENKRISEAFE